MKSPGPASAMNSSRSPQRIRARPLDDVDHALELAVVMRAGLRVGVDVDRAGPQLLRAGARGVDRRRAVMPGVCGVFGSSSPGMHDADAVGAPIGLCHLVSVARASRRSSSRRSASSCDELERAARRRRAPRRCGRAGAAARRASRAGSGSRRASSPSTIAEAGLRPLGLGDRDGAVELDDRRARQPRRARRRAPRSAASRAARRRAATRSPPARRTGRGRAARARGRARRGPAAICAASQSERSWSASSTSSPSREARVAARVVQQHQRQQPVHLGLVGHQLGERAAEPDRLGGEVAAARRSPR